MKQQSSNRGFTLLLAALIASIVLSLGAAIFSIAQKQLALSSIGQESQFAFYAADSIAECALYWDFRDSYFATSTPSSVSPKCDQQTITPFTVVNSTTNNPENLPYSYPYTMTSPQVNIFQDTTPGGYCAQVSVMKFLDQTTGAVRTTIHADGYSIDCADVSTSPRALQRSVELHY